MTHQRDFFGLSLDEIMHLTDKTAFAQPREVRKPRLRDVLGEASHDGADEAHDDRSTGAQRHA